MPAAESVGIFIIGFGSGCVATSIYCLVLIARDHKERMKRLQELTSNWERKP